MCDYTARAVIIENTIFQGALGIIGNNELRHRYTLFANDTTSFDITSITEWLTPNREPEIPQSCPHPTS
jgi:hypothetical protein